MSPPLTARVARPFRVKRRVALRYGPAFPLLGTGFTSNLSMRGLSIFGSSVHKPGAHLSLELRLPGDTPCRVEARIAWALRGAAAIRQPNQLGLEIISADESYYGFLLSAPGFGPDLAPAGAQPPPPPQLRVVTPAPPAPRPRAERHPVTLPFRFCETRALFLSGVILNVSLNGLCFRSNRRLEVGTSLKFAADSPIGPLEGMGSVIWTRPTESSDRHGLRLTQVDEGWFRYLFHVS